ncbi:hypothetical protein D0B54_20350 [Solimonas sp. K1W22B-7]|uniref:hypothetical protein n=1 Tax=Solimonas sp. K1W22B-7 TaxID=2303331 RepID=UPI000E337693|nr:hypothetical protein [Solimonas sp. K1W22B-7]AXQ30887.1 hypothetical protein D0B54_20350 [Solimonas sp. K1W22B-7]
MQLHQINIQYDPAQDRLLLRISTRDKQEYHLWLTRRLTALWWPALFQVLGHSEPVRQHSDPQTQKAVLEFQHQHALEGTDFRKQFEPGELSPAMAPLLVNKVQMRRAGEEHYLLLFSPQEGPGLEIRLPEKTVHALAKLIDEGVKLAEWGLTAPDAAQPTLAPAERKHIN